jgi:hypothetical protein
LPDVPGTGTAFRDDALAAADIVPDLIVDSVGDWP